MSGTYTKTTHSIKVTVRPMFLEEESTPQQDHYVWAYQIQIQNFRADPVQLLSRSWKILDSQGRAQEIRGEGVVGSQPVLKPGETFEYTSGIPLKTPSGMMIGAYEMESESGDIFQVEIPAFSLDSPHERSIIH